MDIPQKPKAFTKDYSEYGSKQIVKEIEALRQSIGQTIIDFGDSALTTPNVVRRQTDILYLISRLNEISTRRIVWMTVFLLFFAIALFAVEVRAVFFPQNMYTYPHTEQQGQHQQIVVPSITN